MKFTLIFEPKRACTLPKEVEVEGNIVVVECAQGVYVVKPEDSSNLSGIIEGCKVHLPQAGAKTELFILEQKQYGKPKAKVDNEGKEIMKPHIKTDGSVAVYGPNHPTGIEGEPVMVFDFEPKSVRTILTADANDVSVYLNSLKDVFV